MATRKKKNNIGAFGHPIYGKGFAKYGEMRPSGSSEIPNDLEEAAEISFDEAKSLTEDYLNFLAKGLKENRPRPIGPYWFCEYAKNRFIAGAEWQREKSEKPTTAEGLEEEIKSFLDKTGAPYYWCDDKEQMDWVGIIARHFYELGRQSKPVLSDDLEKAAREYAMDDFYNGYSSGSIIEDTMKNFKAGAEWGRRNLLQEIADGKTHPVDRITAAWLDNTEG